MPGLLLRTIWRRGIGWVGRIRLFLLLAFYMLVGMSLVIICSLHAFMEVLFGRKSSMSWLPLTWLRVRMLSYLGYVVRVVGMVLEGSINRFFDVLRFIRYGRNGIVVTMGVRLVNSLFFFQLIQDCIHARAVSW